MPKIPETFQGLCFRCEHRAEFLERGHGPRHECGCVNMQLCCCYMFEPCKPIVLQRNDHDRRGIDMPWMFRARSHGLKLLDVACTVRYVNKRTHKYIIERKQK